MTSSQAANAEGLLAVGKPGRALEAITTGLAGAPHDRDLLFLLVRALMMLGQSVQAVAAAEELLAQQPNWARAHWIHALALANRWPLSPDRIQHLAVPAAAEAVRLSPSSPEAHYFLAYCLVRSVRNPSRRRDVTDRARQAALHALRLAPQWVPPLLLLAQVERADRNPKKASQYAETALELDPTNSQTLLSAIDHAPLARRRTLARRLAAVDPSHTATDLVLRTHRPMPGWVTLAGSVVLGLSAVAADLVNFGELGKGTGGLWALGPITGISIAALAFSWRRHQLLSFDIESRSVVFAAERRSRWVRWIGLALLSALPVTWIPAAVIGDHPSAWSVGWVVAGVVVVLFMRPRFGRAETAIA